MASIRKLWRALKKNAGGNATMIVALGMPALIGGTGFAVDTAQWYMWKRELQFAVDQAAIAGAWARADNATKDTYATRATQEYDANIEQTEDFNAEPTVSLANFSGGSANSVAVSATATKKLPFSSFITGKAVTIYAYAQASFEDGKTYSSCLVAVDDDASGAVTISGATVLTARCGLAALSTASDSVKVNGSPTIDVGWVLSKGGVDDWFNDTDNIVEEYLDDLKDPFEGVEPPNPAESQNERTYSCKETTGTTTANVKTTTTVSYVYEKGTKNNANPHAYTNPKDGFTNVSYETGAYVPNTTVEGTVTQPATEDWTKIDGNGNNTIWEVKRTQISKQYTNVATQGGLPQGTVLPGTYTDLKIKCDTIFRTGVYILDGGDLEITGQYQVTGSNVMFVLKNGAGLKITGGSNINLTAIQASDLIARGVDEEQADKLAGMLIFEARNSQGSNTNKINGNAKTVLNGAIYLPVSAMEMAGTASVTSQCLMIAASTIKLSGTLDMSTFCPSDMTEDHTVLSTEPKVRLVA